MKGISSFFSAFCLCIVVCCGLSYQPSENDIKIQFHEFINTYHRTYKTGTAEYTKRFQIFRDNLVHHLYLNKLRPTNSSAWYGVNKFSDLSHQEFKDLYLTDIIPSGLLQSKPQRKPSHQALNQMLNTEALPQKVDWRQKNLVTPIKNQESCGGCWAFSIVQTIEGMNAKVTGKLTELSVQQVIDCSFGYRNLYGCKGGDTCGALDWLNKSKTQLVTEKQYPLKDKAQSCTIAKNETKGVQVKRYKCQSFEDNEKGMLNWIATHGPVAVAVDATNWNNYLGGVVQYHCGENPNNHAVEIVGYDLTGDVPYYIAKNSWGPDFGNEGYIYIGIGNNVCGVAREVAQVDV